MVIEFPRWVGEMAPGVLGIVVAIAGWFIGKHIHATGQRESRKAREARRPAE